MFIMNLSINEKTTTNLTAGEVDPELSNPNAPDHNGGNHGLFSAKS